MACSALKLCGNDLDAPPADAEPPFPLWNQ
jgi:hypothetical protein